jgi:hypothetical protein
LDYLSDKRNYNLLGKNSFLSRMLFVKPFYASSKDISPDVPLKHSIIRVIGSILLIKFGYELAVWETKEESEKLLNHKVVEFETEEQIFDLLYNKQKDAVFLYFFTPGHRRMNMFMRDFELESSNPRYKDITFMNVHCRKNLTFCVNKDFPERILPMAELYYINEQDKIELVDMSNRHRSPQGIQGFFEESGILESAHNPEEIFERAGKKLKGIMV